MGPAGEFDGQPIGFILEFAVIAAFDEAADDVAQGVLEDARQLGQGVGGIGLDGRRAQELESVHEPRLLDRLQPMLGVDVPDLVGQDEGQGVFVLAALDQALGQKDQAAGGGQGVHFIGIQDQEMISGKGLRPVGIEGDGAAHGADVLG